MSFTYPLGLIGLIGIPILIIIYILRSKYNEQTVTSVYLWRLSEKFLKRKNPLSGLTGIISLILQILTVAVVSLAIAHPVFVMPNAAADYYFVVDSSGSMNMQSGKQTRFDVAKEEVIDIIESAADGSSYSLVCVSDSTESVFEYVTSKDKAVEAVERLRCGNANGTSDDMRKVAQRLFDSDRSAYVYLVTDKTYESTENIRLVDVGSQGENYAIYDTSYSHSGGKLKVDATVASFESDATLEVRLFLDGASEAAATATVSVKADEPETLSLECTALKFTSFRIEIANEDMYAADNAVESYNLKTEKIYSTLIVSENGFFFRAVIDALVDSDVEIISPDDYAKHEGEYGLYIFDSYTPEKLPDASVWLINTDRSIPDSGFAIRDKIDIGEAAAIEKSSSTSTSVRTLLSGVDGNDIYIDRYVKYSGMYLSFSTLFSYEGNPLIFAGTNGIGNRQVVFGFDINESDLALSPDFVILLGNLLDYSFPSVIEQSNFAAGEVATVNVVANSSNLKAFAPSGKEVYLESDGAIASLPLDEIGVYTVSITIAGEESEYKIYSGAHPGESEPDVTESSFALAGESSNDRRDGEYDPLLILFICLAILFIADWGVFCYEKYQLR